MHIDEIVDAIQRNFCTFGGRREASDGNPINYASKDEPAQFAAGVSVKDVARFVLQQTQVEG